MQTATAGGSDKGGGRGKVDEAPGRTHRGELLELSLAEDDVAKVQWWFCLQEKSFNTSKSV